MFFVRERPRLPGLLNLLFIIAALAGPLAARAVHAAGFTAVPFVLAGAYILAVPPLMLICQYVTPRDASPERGELWLWFSGTASLGAGLLVAAGTPDLLLRLGLGVLLAGAGVAYALAAGTTLLTDKWLDGVRRFPGPHECDACGYDLTGVPSMRCPECGQPRRCPDCERRIMVAVGGQCPFCGTQVTTAVNPEEDDEPIPLE